MEVPTIGTIKNLGEVETVETKLTWRINHISKYCELSNIECESPAFKTMSSDGESVWKLVLSTDDDSCENSGNDTKYFDIYLNSMNLKVVRATVKFYVLSTFYKELEPNTLIDQEFEPGDGWGHGEFIVREQLSKQMNKYSRNDCLTIVCTIITGKFIEIESQKDIIRDEEQQKLLEFKNYAKLLNNPVFSDIVFVIEEQKIYSHQAILANRSPIFKTMFTSRLSKMKNNRVDISDVNYVAMHDMISYIYTGIVPKYGRSGNEPGESYMNLLTAAEKYHVDYLKEECEKKLSDFLKVNNVFEYLKFSDMQKAPYLKEKAIEFIVDYGREIVELSSFKKHCNELNGDIVSEVFQALIIKKRRIE